MIRCVFDMSVGDSGYVGDVIGSLFCRFYEGIEESTSCLVYDGDAGQKLLVTSADELAVKAYFFDIFAFLRTGFVRRRSF